MALTWLTTQIAPLAANAGNQFNQTVDVSSGGGSAGYPIQQQQGPGWATPTGASVADSPTSSTTSSTNWGQIAFFLAVAYFALRRLS